MSLLGEYLCEAAMRRWDAGRHDCCTFPADWCIVAGYPDPMAFIRGRYSSDAEAATLVKQQGLIRLATQGFASIGLARAAHALCGDVAVIKTLTEDGANVCCGIRSGDRWMSLIASGIVGDADALALRIWRVQWARL